MIDFQILAWAARFAAKWVVLWSAAIIVVTLAVLLLGWLPEPLGAAVLMGSFLVGFGALVGAAVLYLVASAGRLLARWNGSQS